PRPSIGSARTDSSPSSRERTQGGSPQRRASSTPPSCASAAPGPPPRRTPEAQGARRPHRAPSACGDADTARPGEAQVPISSRPGAHDRARTGRPRERGTEMTETNYPYGAAERPEQPGGRPPHGSEAYGYGEDPAASAPSANPVGPAPSAPTWGPAPTAPDAPPTSPPSPAPPTSASSAQAGATLRKVGIGNPLPTFAVGVAAYVVALVASVLVIVSLFLAALTLDTGDVTGGAGMSGGGSASPSDGLGWRGFVGLV